MQRAFGERPKRLRSVAVWTDSDDLKGDSQAWYGDIALAAS
jgi:hypothetical protein